MSSAPWSKRSAGYRALVNLRRERGVLFCFFVHDGPAQYRLGNRTRHFVSVIEHGHFVLRWLRGSVEGDEAFWLTMIVPQSTAYGWLMLAGIVVSIYFWAKLARRDGRLLMVYVAALIGAFLGAKVFYLLVDGWRVIGQRDTWIQLATGKTVLGALLGGYVGVEIAKRLVGYRSVTGDWFALIAPVGIILGRIGCLLHGCCQGKVCEPAWFTVTDSAGVARWPSVPMEILFNLVTIAAFFFLRHRRLLPGQHFHLYLIAYGAFRFFHEFLRSESRLLGPLTGYQLLAAGVTVFGSVAFILRRNMTASVVVTKSA